LGFEGIGDLRFEEKEVKAQIDEVQKFHRFYDVLYQKIRKSQVFSYD
jgi:hypothetical protein